MKGDAVQVAPDHITKHLYDDTKELVLFPLGNGEPLKDFHAEGYYGHIYILHIYIFTKYSENSIES